MNTKATWCAQVTQQGRVGVLRPGEAVSPRSEQLPSTQGKAQCQPRQSELALHLGRGQHCCRQVPTRCQRQGRKGLRALEKCVWGSRAPPKAAPPKTGEMASTD